MGHILKEISRWSAFFLEHGESTEGRINGDRRHSRGAGGIEIPCELTFLGKKHILKMKRLIDSLNSSVYFMHWIGKTMSQVHIITISSR